VTLDDVDQGVRECLSARQLCRAFEVTRTSMQKRRTGNAALDVMRFQRETHTTGWRFNGLILIKDDLVVYKLAGGQPLVHLIEEQRDALAPLQALGTKFNNLNSALQAGRSSSQSIPASPALGVAAR
jgi:CelD/BcsL family acetyltransferase involved in cellulose biosynthesis